MIITQDPETGYWNVGLRNTHEPAQCEGRLCDVHNRRGSGAQATWPLNWRIDRAMFEVICPCGIGHPTPAQVGYWETVCYSAQARVNTIHGCCEVHCPVR